MFSCVFSLVWHTALALCDTVVIRQLAFAPGLQRRRLQIACRKKTVLKAWCLTAWSLRSHTACTVPLIAYSELSTTALTCSPLHSNWTTVSSKRMKNAPKKRKVCSQSFARCSRKLFVDVVLFPVFLPCSITMKAVYIEQNSLTDFLPSSSSISRSRRGPSRRCTTMSAVDSTSPEISNWTCGIVS